MEAMCKKCTMLGGVVLLVLGLLYLLSDLAVIGWWNLNWWTVVFLLMGLLHLGKGHCHDCLTMGKKKK